MGSRHTDEIKQTLKLKMNEFIDRVEWLEDGFEKKEIPASMEKAAIDDIVSMKKAIKMLREMITIAEAQESGLLIHND
jgi:uncharacterized protein (UPF0335 family)